MPRGRPRLEENKAYTDRTTLILYPNGLSPIHRRRPYCWGAFLIFLLLLSLSVAMQCHFFTFTIVFFLYINLKKMKGEQKVKISFFVGFLFLLRVKEVKEVTEKMPLIKVFVHTNIFFCCSSFLVVTVRCRTIARRGWAVTRASRRVTWRCRTVAWARWRIAR